MKLSLNEYNELSNMLASLLETDEPDTRHYYIITFLDKYEEISCFTITNEQRKNIGRMLISCAENDNGFRVIAKTAIIKNALKQFDINGFIKVLESLI